MPSLTYKPSPAFSKPRHRPHRLAKALRTQIIRSRRFYPLLLIPFFLLVLLSPPASVPPPLLHMPQTPTLLDSFSSIHTPLIRLPEPYGFAAPVMTSVLPTIGAFLMGGSFLNLPLLADSIDQNHFHGTLLGVDPVTKQPMWKPTPFDFSKETLEQKKKAHEKSCYNKRRSDSLPLDRPIPDVRPTACKREWYYNPSGTTKFGDSTPRLMNTSVIFVFYNEPLSPLLRAIYSVLDRTPAHLLHEIILVDDGSDEEAPWLGEGREFEQHLQLLPKTKLARLIGRNGLMRARNVGASVATGETLTFLDAHIEVGEGWLEPLVGRVTEGVKEGVDRVVVPAIDNIDADDFKYNAGGIDVLGHTWGLGQTGISSGFMFNGAKPTRSPIMAGGLLCLSREYFDKLGFYDPEMELWGGEEMEISFRIWLCGGTLECVPCSRVGHVFRSNKYWQGQVYKVPGEVIARNKRRASFWMDEYGELARLSSPPLKDGQTLGSMAHYENIKERLQCKPYRWYLENIYPQMLKSANELMGEGGGMTGFLASGFLRNGETGTCLDHLHYKGDGSVMGVYPCHYLRGSQSLVFTKSNRLLSSDFLLDGCVTAEWNDRLKRQKCGRGKAMTWEMEILDDDQGVRFKSRGKCLTVVHMFEEEEKSPFTLRMKTCGGEDADFQVWDWEQTHYNLISDGKNNNNNVSMALSP